jgi:hypothetical protein
MPRSRTGNVGGFGVEPRCRNDHVVNRHALRSVAGHGVPVRELPEFGGVDDPLVGQVKAAS